MLEQFDQLIVVVVLLVALVLFITERIRYDIVALLALLTLVIVGILPGDEAFSGFGHPAVITVAGVLVISQALINSGVVDIVARQMLRVGGGPALQIAALTGLTAICSALMNNVAAVALLMPVAIQMARKHGNSPSLLLMPLAYGSLLGGMMTLIGTPPNIIISTYRQEALGEPFRMFDFLPAGAGVALAGILYMALIGWRLIPQRTGQSSREELFRINAYSTELRVPDDSRFLGRFLRDLPAINQNDIVIAGLVRNERRLLIPSSITVVRAGDVLIVQADPQSLQELIDATEFELVDEAITEAMLRSEEVNLVEAVVIANSPLIGQTVRSFDLRGRYNVNLLAVARAGERLRARLADVQFYRGDVLLLQMRREAVADVLGLLGCLPLAERGLRLGQRRRMILVVGIFAAAITIATMGLLPIQIPIVAAAVLMVLVGAITLRDAYQSIEWPILVLLGAMLPVADALERTGGTDWLAAQFVAVAGQSSPALALTIILIGAMILTPLINNAAAAVLMAPIAISVANGLGASPDPFLLATAIGVSCDFLTPIGHQSNTLVMGPGGYKFGDYWRMGLAIEVLVVITAVPLLLIFWPL